MNCEDRLKAVHKLMQEILMKITTNNTNILLLTKHNFKRFNIFTIQFYFNIDSNQCLI
jgi:hypothetical protein